MEEGGGRQFVRTGATAQTGLPKLTATTFISTFVTDIIIIKNFYCVIILIICRRFAIYPILTQTTGLFLYRFYCMFMFRSSYNAADCGAPSIAG